MRRGTFGLLVLASTLIACGGGNPLGGGGGGLGGLTGGGAGGGGSSDGTLSSECTSGGVGNAKLTAALSATSEFLGAASSVQQATLDTCKEMGSKLGIADSKMSGGKQPTRTACNAVADKLRSEMQSLVAKGNLQIEVGATPPRCEVKMDAYADCYAECQADVEPGKVDVQCEGGEIVGECSAECTGQCNVDVQGKCEGTCEGTCKGGCKGTCNGACEGECSSRNAEGQCAGKCEGKCQGTCEGGCEGTCEGECWVSGEASCSGECRGGCSVDYKAPRCTGEVVPPKAEAECKGSCDAKLNANAECAPGEVYVTIKGDVQENISDRVDNLRGAIEAGYAGLQVAKLRLQRLKKAGGSLKASVQGLGGGIASGGLKAGQCVTEAAAALTTVLPKITVSMEASVSVSGALSASAG